MIYHNPHFIQAPHGLKSLQNIILNGISAGKAKMSYLPNIIIM